VEPVVRAAVPGTTHDNRTQRERSAAGEAGPRLLYWWLLLAIAVEYARPASFFEALDLPYLYSVIPLSLFVASTFASGLRPLRDVFADRLAKWVFILLAVVVVSALLAEVWSYATPKLEAVVGYVVLFVLIARIIRTKAALRGLFVVLLGAHFFLLALNPDALLNPSTRNYIVGATFLGDGNDFSLSLCILLPCAIELTQSSRNWAKRLLAWAAVALTVLAIVATQSRGGTLGIAAVLGYYWLRSPRKLLALVASAAVVLAVLLYAPSQYFQRMGTMGASQLDGSAQGRIDAWKAGLGMGAKNPILGVGPGHFGARWGRTAHSTYMLAFAELGLPGLVCVLVLVFGSLRANRLLQQRLLARAGPTSLAQTESNVQMLFATSAAMLGFAAAGAFLSATYYPHLFVLSGILVSARAIVAKEADAAAAGEQSGSRDLRSCGPAQLVPVGLTGGDHHANRGQQYSRPRHPGPPGLPGRTAGNR